MNAHPEIWQWLRKGSTRLSTCVLAARPRVRLRVCKGGNSVAAGNHAQRATPRGISSFRFMKIYNRLLNKNTNENTDSLATCRFFGGIVGFLFVTLNTITNWPAAAGTAFQSVESMSPAETSTNETTLIPTCSTLRPSPRARSTSTAMTRFNSCWRPTDTHRHQCNGQAARHSSTTTTISSRSGTQPRFAGTHLLACNCQRLAQPSQPFEQRPPHACPKQGSTALIKPGS